MGLFDKERNLSRAPERVDLAVRASDFRLKNEDLLLRLDAFLAERLTWRSRNSIQDLVRDGYVEVAQNGPERQDRPAEFKRTKRPSAKLRHGAIVRVWIPPELRLPEVTATSEGVHILHEEEDFLVVDKPPLAPVHPSGRHLTGTVIQAVHAHYAELVGEDADEIPVRLAHRLDRETSGVLLLGKTKEAHRVLRAAFEEHRITKTYLAIVEGTPDEDQGSIRLPITPAIQSAVRLKMTTAIHGLESRTDWRLLQSFGPVSLVECQLFTGRQHQIRVHLSAIGHPIVGDKLYGPDETVFIRAADGTLTPEDERALRLPRQALHHHRLGFERPSDGSWLDVESELPEDLEEFLGQWS